MEHLACPLPSSLSHTHLGALLRPKNTQAYNRQAELRRPVLTQSLTDRCADMSAEYVRAVEVLTTKQSFAPRMQGSLWSSHFV